MKIHRRGGDGVGVAKSPIRTVFGLDPSSGNIVVPIDLCTYTVDASSNEIGPDPSLAAFLIGTDILQSDTGVSIGKILVADTPSPAEDVNPFVILDRRSSNISTIDMINLDRVSIGSSITLDTGSTTISGKVSNTLDTVAFPNDASLTIRAFEVTLATPIGSQFQGSPIMLGRSTLGMLLGTGRTVLACPFV